MSFLAAVASNASQATNATSSSSSSSAGAASAGAAGGAPAGPAVDNSVFLFDIDIVLLCAVALFFLLLLPRAAIRFTHKREWIDGHFLRSIYLDHRPSVTRLPAKRQDVISPVSQAHMPELKGGPESYEDHATSYGHGIWGGPTTDASHTYVTHADVLRKASTATARERRRQNVPTHMPGWSTMLPAPAAWLRVGVRPGMTVGKTLMILAYFGLMLYAGLYMSNPLSDPVRAGFLAVSQIPVIIALGTKNNLVGLLIGFGYERVSFPFMKFTTVLFRLPFGVFLVPAPTAVPGIKLLLYSVLTPFWRS